MTRFTLAFVLVLISAANAQDIEEPSKLWASFVGAPDDCGVDLDVAVDDAVLKVNQGGGNYLRITSEDEIIWMPQSETYTKLTVSTAKIVAGGNHVGCALTVAKSFIHVTNSKQPMISERVDVRPAREMIRTNHVHKGTVPLTVTSPLSNAEHVTNAIAFLLNAEQAQ